MLYDQERDYSIEEKLRDKQPVMAFSEMANADAPEARSQERP